LRRRNQLRAGHPLPIPRPPLLPNFVGQRHRS